jgi:hypothetical protein
MIYRSKRDNWVMLSFALAVISPVALGVFLLIASPAKLASWLLIGIGIAAGIIIYWLSNSLYYEITESKLNVRFGPMRWIITLESIAEVYPTRSPFSSPALSLDRLLIKYENLQGTSALMVSPQDQTAFVKALAAAEPRLKLVGNALKSYWTIPGKEA